MGYHVTILRTADGAQEPITRSELLGAVARHPELQVREADATLEITAAPPAEDNFLLIWQDGEIWTKNPSDDLLVLMLRLADDLGARVRGDELETYRAPDETYVHSDDRAAVEQNAAAARRVAVRARRGRWVRVALVAAVFIGIVVRALRG